MILLLGIKQIPFILGSLSKLQYLNLSKNELKIIPFSFLEKFTQLKKLDLSSKFFCKKI